MKELVIISGKGGTGKTSVTAAFVALASNAVIADCDVDAADMHLIMTPAETERHEFFSGHEAVIDTNSCIGCGACQFHCRFDATRKIKRPSGGWISSVDPAGCEGCGVCVHFCPVQAIEFRERRCGEWMISQTRYGTMVHAKLGVAAENSGKLVSVIRREAKRIAEETQTGLIIVDGPPGIGCPVIASVTGASHVLIVTEPTVSGEHDLERVLALTKHFNIPASVCVNKWDINEEMTERIEQKSRNSGAVVAGRIRYDREVTKAQVQRMTVIESNAPSAVDIQNIWTQLGF